MEDADDWLDVRCETSTGVPVSRDEALRAMISGHVRRVVVDSAGVIIDLGQLRRCFTGSARRAAQLLVHTCVHPGCDIPAEFCDVDHLHRHTDGGPTDQHNGGPACRTHNLFKENARLRSRRAINGRIYLIRPDGTTILPVGERPPEWAEPDPIINDPQSAARPAEVAEPGASPSEAQPPDRPIADDLRADRSDRVRTSEPALCGDHHRWSGKQTIGRDGFVRWNRTLAPGHRWAIRHVGASEIRVLDDPS